MGTDETAEQCKNAGNELFTKKGDNVGAIKQYLRAVELLLKHFEISSIGASVIVKVDESSSEFATGMVSGYDDIGKKFEVCFDDGSEEGEIDAKLITPLADPEQRELQRSCYLNLARVYFKMLKPGWSIRYSSMALAVSRVLGDGEYRHEGSSLNHSDADLPPKYRRLIADCLFIRGKACLEAGVHRTAQQHADLLVNQQIDAAKGKLLHKEVLAFRERRVRSNRKLAKHMAEWVEHAVDLSALAAKEASPSGEGGGGGGAVYGEEGPRGSEHREARSLEQDEDDDAADDDGGEGSEGGEKRGNGEENCSVQ